jgi:hypothetical protein
VRPLIGIWQSCPVASFRATHNPFTGRNRLVFEIESWQRERRHATECNVTAHLIGADDAVFPQFLVCHPLVPINNREKLDKIFLDTEYVAAV